MRIHSGTLYFPVKFTKNIFHWLCVTSEWIALRHQSLEDELYSEQNENKMMTNQTKCERFKRFCLSLLLQLASDFGCFECFIGWRKLVISFVVRLVQVINSTRVRRLRYFLYILSVSLDICYIGHIWTRMGARDEDKRETFMSKYFLWTYKSLRRRIS